MHPPKTRSCSGQGEKRATCPPSSSGIYFPFCASDISVMSCLHPQPSAGGTLEHHLGASCCETTISALSHLWGGCEAPKDMSSPPFSSPLFQAGLHEERGGGFHPSAAPVHAPTFCRLKQLSAQATFLLLALFFKADLLINHISQQQSFRLSTPPGPGRSPGRGGGSSPG